MRKLKLKKRQNQEILMVLLFLYQETDLSYLKQNNRGLLKAAIRCDDPVVYMEHKGLWGSVGEVNENDVEPLPLGKARIVKEGSDLTIVTWAGMVSVVEKAAITLSEEGVSTEVIDLRTLWPWDREAVFSSVIKTGRMMVVHEAVQVGGFGGEISSEVTEHLFDNLKGPVKRMGGARIPIPFSIPLEESYMISQEQVIAKARSFF